MGIILEIPDDKVSKYSPKYVSLVIIKRHLQVRTILRRGMKMTSVLDGMESSWSLVSSETRVCINSYKIVGGSFNINPLFPCY